MLTLLVLQHRMMVVDGWVEEWGPQIQYPVVTNKLLYTGCMYSTYMYVSAYKVICNCLHMNDLGNHAQ